MTKRNVCMQGEEVLEPAQQQPRTERAMRSNRGGDGSAVSSGFSARSDLRAGIFWVAAVPAKPSYKDVPIYTDISWLIASR